MSVFGLRLRFGILAISVTSWMTAFKKFHDGLLLADCGLTRPRQSIHAISAATHGSCLSKRRSPCVVMHGLR